MITININLVVDPVLTGEQLAIALGAVLDTITPGYEIDRLIEFDATDVAAVINLDDATPIGVQADVAALNFATQGLLELSKDAIISDGIDFATLTYTPGVGSAAAVDILIDGATVNIAAATPREIRATGVLGVPIDPIYGTIIVYTPSLASYFGPTVVSEPDPDKVTLEGTYGAKGDAGAAGPAGSVGPQGIPGLNGAPGLSVQPFAHYELIPAGSYVISNVVWTQLGLSDPLFSWAVPAQAQTKRFVLMAQLAVERVSGSPVVYFNFMVNGVTLSAQTYGFGRVKVNADLPYQIVHVTSIPFVPGATLAAKILWKVDADSARVHTETSTSFVIAHQIGDETD